MKEKRLTEEKEDLMIILLDIISSLEQVMVCQIDITNVIPISRGLKVVYTVATDRVRQWSRVINYSTLANEI